MRKRLMVGITLAFLALLALISASLNAQDFHMSQYDATTLYMNPALTGMYLGEKGDFRITDDYRQQWKALGIKPFSTIYLSYDMPVTVKKKKIGLGAYLVNERAGQGNFNTLEFMASAAYNIIEGSEKHYLTTGLQLGFFNKSFSPSSFTYDAQYSGSTGNFDSNLPTDESNSNTNLLRLDANVGIYYKFIATESKVHPYAGFSIDHLNIPKETFAGTTTRLPMRFNYNAGCDIKVNETFTVVPKVLYMQQSTATELFFGAEMRYKLSGEYTALLNLNYRNQDAFVFDIGLKKGGHVLRLGYDLNTSGLSNYTGGRGAFEISLIITGIKGQSLFSNKARI